MNDDTQDDKNSIDDENTNEDRREVLQKLGRYAYTAPVMLTPRQIRTGDTFFNDWLKIRVW